jgi:SAM-dependent methyltransferase
MSSQWGNGEMAASGFQLTGNAAALYESQKVPAMFGPLADATLKQVPLHSDDVVLDIACGTGIVARKVREVIGPEARIVGTDLNAGMIDIARNLVDEQSRSCEWEVADATDLPFADKSFSIAFCQQGLQFIPDKERVIGEVHRLLRPSGRLAWTVWSGKSEFILPIAEALDRHVSDAVAEKSLAPYACDSRTLVPMMERTGFIDIAIEDFAIERVMPASEKAVRDELLGLPVASEIMAKGDEVLNKLVQDTMAAFDRHRRGTDFVIPQVTSLIQAKIEP